MKFFIILLDGEMWEEKSIETENHHKQNKKINRKSNI